MTRSQMLYTISGALLAVVVIRAINGYEAFSVGAVSPARFIGSLLINLIMATVVAVFARRSAKDEAGTN